MARKSNKGTGSGNGMTQEEIGWFFEEFFESVSNRLTTGLERNVLQATMIWHGAVVEMLTGERSGRTYRIPGSKKKYRASRPGEAPASRTGRLRTSYRFRTEKKKRFLFRGYKLNGIVGSPLQYAEWLEKGTSKMAPRPHVEPAYRNVESQIKATLARDIE